MVIMFGLHDRNQMRVNGEPMREYVPFRFEKLTAMQVKKLNKEKADAEIAIMNKPITERVDKVFMNRFEEGDGDDSRLVRTRHRDGSGAMNKGSTQNNTPVACPSLPVSDVNYHDSSSLGPVSRRSRTVFRRARQSATESDTEIIEKPVSPKDIPKGIITSRDLPVRNNIDSPRLNVPTISSEINSKSKLNSGNGNDNDNEETATDENGNCGKYGFRTHSTYVSS